ncbi:hypothetical protein NDU88_000549 [Pleurodeles waltl]|uniref:Uncharacterized protein n=1 Tax=Pleurodeles waltl TaxID=8319 RepID=A0AAV7KY44_PLEWA|nr:hypothetical protein NDU88_000549 [Pleurodeles waltl]
MGKNTASIIKQTPKRRLTRVRSGGPGRAHLRTPQATRCTHRKHASGPRRALAPKRLSHELSTGGHLAHGRALTDSYAQQGGEYTDKATAHARNSDSPAHIGTDTEQTRHAGAGRRQTHAGHQRTHTGAKQIAGTHKKNTTSKSRGSE